MISIAKPVIDENEKQRVMDVLNSGMLSIGAVVKEFEEAFTGYTSTKYGVATSSGTSALHVALAASGIKEGDKVITTPFTFIATSNSILYCGAKPIFCDIEEDTFNLDPRKIREILQKEKDVKAILLVHLYGHPCDMDEIMNIVREYKLVLIEDCAQAHGCYYDGKHVGNFGASGTFSFYPTKNMTTAEGGMVITNSEEVYKNSRFIREHGMSGAGAYDYSMLGYNYRMTNIEAAIGLGQMDKLAGFNNARAANAKYFNEHLSDLEWLKIPAVKDKAVHCYHQYTLKVRDRERFTKHLQDNGVGFKVFYPALIQDAPMYRDMGYNGNDCPVARRMCDEVVSIPVHPSLTKDDLEKIVSVIRSFKPVLTGARQEG
jgi:perosamine synthetase